MAEQLKILAYGLAGLLGLLFLLAIPRVMLVLKALSTQAVRWPGPPTINSSPRDFQTEVRLGIPPKPLFPSFFQNLFGIICGISLMLFFALIQIDNIVKLSGLKFYMGVGLFIVILYASASWGIRLWRNMSHIDQLAKLPRSPKPAYSHQDSSMEQAAKLTNRAFMEVEQENFDQAILLLEQALRINSSCGDAYNELAFIHGRFKDNLDLAEQYARRAVECDPQNPKFRNAVNGIQMARIQRLQTRAQIRTSVKQSLDSIEHQIAVNSNYPPGHLAKAVALAMGGEAVNCWESELQIAQKLYLEQKKSVSGFSLSEKDVLNIINKTRDECVNMSKFWENSRE